MRDVAGEVERRRKEVEAEAAAKEEKARARAEAKVAGEQEADALIAAFEACEHGCVCDVPPCMMAKWKPSGAQLVGPRAACARPGHVWLLASLCYLATTRLCASRHCSNPGLI